MYNGYVAVCKAFIDSTDGLPRVIRVENMFLRRRKSM